jgi:ureidoacrylate peracid hydrolase
MKSLQKLTVNPANAVLIIVDVQNEFCQPGGKVYTETSARVSPGVIARVKDLSGRARRAGVPIIYIQSVRTLTEPQFTVFKSRPSLEIGTWASEIVADLTPQGEDIVVQKRSHDPFYRTELDAVLERLVPDPTSCCAIVTGGTINVCVYHTLLGLYARNYWTVVPEDCVFYIIESGKRIALEHVTMSGYPNIFLSRSDLIEVSPVRRAVPPDLVPGS